MLKRRKPTVYLGADHAAFILKEDLRKHLLRTGYKVVDMGAFDDSPSDYPDFIIPAVEAAMASAGRGVAIVLGGSGIGECIAANKVRGAQAALAYDRYTARMSREHNNANVLCLGARTASGKSAQAKRLVRLWLETPFSGATRHRRRLKKISKYEKST
ncbi:MAG: RpiB/LacA/LacB family sugar-phosphate isomerase [Patescibacteria group bacterium]|nr:RpiB/LacA/LacB family sugar-phosphate isomerase [Patescibacteria group bacterium]